MQAIVETLFDAVYLTTVITLGIRMIRGSKQGSQFRLFGWMAVILGAGTPFTWCPGPWPCAPPALKITPLRWEWGSGSPR